jgi:hypothetical protein
MPKLTLGAVDAASSGNVHRGESGLAADGPGFHATQEAGGTLGVAAKVPTRSATGPVGLYRRVIAGHQLKLAPAEPISLRRSARYAPRPPKVLQLPIGKPYRLTLAVPADKPASRHPRRHNASRGFSTVILHQKAGKCAVGIICSWTP